VLRRAATGSGAGESVRKGGGCRAGECGENERGWLAPARKRGVETCAELSRSFKSCRKGRLSAGGRGQRGGGGGRRGG